MQKIEVIYLSCILTGMCVAYISLFFLFQKVYKNNKSVIKPNGNSLVSLLIIAVLNIAIYFISYHIIQNEFIANRFLHSIGGGLMVFLICLLAVKDSKTEISNKNLLLTGFVIVTVLGISNELIEYFLQNHIDFVFAPNSTDTELDLASNIIGYFISSIYLVSFKSKA